MILHLWSYSDVCKVFSVMYPILEDALKFGILVVGGVCGF